jgi:hypothetical protein
MKNHLNLKESADRLKHLSFPSNLIIKTLEIYKLFFFCFFNKFIFDFIIENRIISIVLN